MYKYVYIFNQTVIYHPRAHLVDAATTKAVHETKATHTPYWQRRVWANECPLKDEINMFIKFKYVLESQFRCCFHRPTGLCRRKVKVHTVNVGWQ